MAYWKDSDMALIRNQESGIRNQESGIRNSIRNSIVNYELLWVGGDAAVGVVEHYGSGYFLDHLF